MSNKAALRSAEGQNAHKQAQWTTAVPMTQSYTYASPKSAIPLSGAGNSAQQSFGHCSCHTVVFPLSVAGTPPKTSLIATMQACV